MGFKTFKNTNELFDIIHSVDDTAFIEQIEKDEAFKLIKSAGFKSVSAILDTRLGTGKIFKFVNNDEAIYICFTQPVSEKGKLYMIEKHFFKKTLESYILHRVEKPCSISYHSNGNTFKLSYRFENKTYPILNIDGLEYSHLECIVNVKNTRTYHFRAQPWHVKSIKLNLNNSKNKLSIVKASYCIFNNNNFDLKPTYLEHFKIKHIYPDFNKLNWHQKINLGKSLAKDEITVLEMMLY